MSHTSAINVYHIIVPRSEAVETLCRYRGDYINISKIWLDEYLLRWNGEEYRSAYLAFLLRNKVPLCPVCEENLPLYMLAEIEL